MPSIQIVASFYFMPSGLTFAEAFQWGYALHSAALVGYSKLQLVQNALTQVGIGSVSLYESSTVGVLTVSWFRMQFKMLVVILKALFDLGSGQSRLLFWGKIPVL